MALKLHQLPKRFFIYLDAIPFNRARKKFASSYRGQFIYLTGEYLNQSSPFLGICFFFRFLPPAEALLPVMRKNYSDYFVKSQDFQKHETTAHVSQKIKAQAACRIKISSIKLNRTRWRDESATHWSQDVTPPTTSQGRNRACVTSLTTSTRDCDCSRTLKITSVVLRPALDSPHRVLSFSSPYFFL